MGFCPDTKTHRLYASQTTGDNPTQFLKYDNGPDADERVIVFATEFPYNDWSFVTHGVWMVLLLLHLTCSIICI